MKKISEFRYEISKQLFLKLKPIIDGLAFWSEESDKIELVFGSKSLERTFFFYLKRMHPDLNIVNL